jgi:predicted enzyme related to lactoylglutathione lyase
MFRSGGRIVAGVGPLQSEQQPSVWTTYVGTDDADAIARKVEAAGGTVMLAPFDVLDAGRMGLFADPAGAVFGVWQPGRHTGAEVFNEPVSLTWNELNTRDPEGAKEFYAQVFGWDARSPEGVPYAWLFNGVRGIAGMRVMGDEMPARVPPHWMTYFAVADTDAIVAAAPGLGGTVHVPPTDIPPGRFAMLTDPAGAPFSIVALSEGARQVAATPEGVPAL